MTTPVLESALRGSWPSSVRRLWTLLQVCQPSLWQSSLPLNIIPSQATSEFDWSRFFLFRLFTQICWIGDSFKVCKDFFIINNLNDHFNRFNRVFISTFSKKRLVPAVLCAPWLKVNIWLKNLICNNDYPILVVKFKNFKNKNPGKNFNTKLFWRLGQVVVVQSFLKIHSGSESEH